MKIAILGTRGIPARYGGFETFAEELSVRLAASGVHVTVYCPSRFSRPSELYRGVNLRYVTVPSLGSFTETVWDVKCLWDARSGFDVVYLLGVGAGFAAWLPRLSGSKVWINSDGLEWKRSKWSILQRAYLAFAEALSVRFATRIIADSSAIKSYLQSRYPRIDKVTKIAYGANIPSAAPSQELIKEWGLEADGYYIVVCRLEPENHVLEIIDGFNKAKTSCPLIVLGNIQNPNSYVEKLLARSGEAVRFIGTVYDKEKLASLRFYARAYLHGHSVGGTNPSLLEAMACSNLVIAHDNPFNREVLADSGLFFATSDELAEVIASVDSGQVEIQFKRSRAREVVDARYRWDQIANEYLELLFDRPLRSRVEEEEIHEHAH